MDLIALLGAISIITCSQILNTALLKSFKKPGN